MGFYNPLQGLIGDTRTDLDQVSSRTGRTLQDDMNTPDLGALAGLNGLGQQGIMRFKSPGWSPGEWEELQQARNGGPPTMYGKIMQDRYRRSKHRIPPAPGQLEQEDAALSQRYPVAYPALDLLRGSR